MGLRRLSQVADRLLAHGADPNTPAAVIASGTLPEQRVVVGNLRTIAPLVQKAQLEPPATLVVGRVVELSPWWTEPVGAAPYALASGGKSGR
jgi:siroheme synthase